MSVSDIARPEVRTLRAYVAADQIDGMVRLNANESAESPWADLDRVPLNRYPPTFDMYKVYADIQAVALTRVPLDADANFQFDRDAVLKAADDDSKLIFVCSPNNPTGTLVPRDDILQIAAVRKDRSVVVVDEAYIEFADHESMVRDTLEYDNIVVLRTMSKAFALAGARCGALVGCEEAVTMLSRVLSPYSFSTPVTERVLDAMDASGLAKARDLVRQTIDERERLRAALQGLDVIDTVWASHGNFLFVRFRNIDTIRPALQRSKILIREFASLPEYPGCARITVGTAAENSLLIEALRGI